MAIPLLCVVALLQVIWILLLLSENRGLKSDLQALKQRLQHELDRARGGIQVGSGRRLTPSEIARAETLSRPPR